MVDLAPEHAISLSDFYRRFWLWKWNDNDALDQLDVERRIARLPGERILAHRSNIARVVDRCLEEAVRLFQWKKLSAFVQEGGFDSRRHLSSRAWESAFFPERLFMADTIAVGHGGEFDAAIDRTPFIDERHLEDRLREERVSKTESRSALALRDVIIALVMDGVMEEGEAEIFTARWGLPPLTSHPAANKYDPMKSSAWTLPMVVSWAVWRQYEVVREAMDDYRANCWEWFGFHHRLPVNGGAEWYEVEGSELKTLEPQTLFTLGLLEAMDMQAHPELVTMSVKSAREQLWAALTEGTLTAAGLDTDGKVVQIPAHEWPYIELQANDNGADRLVIRGATRPAYREVTIRQSAVLEVWPSIARDDPKYQFDHSAAQWSLLEASIWVGSAGQELTSQEIADGNLEEEGAAKLFEAFNNSRLVATALNLQRVREVIPAEYWELATMNPDLYRERHYVSFIDEILNEEGGQFTRYGEDKPHWFGIRIARDALLRAFPDVAGTGSTASADNKDAGLGAKSAGAIEALTALYGKDPIPKGLTRKDLLTKVNTWLGQAGHSVVSLRTLARAVREFSSAK